MSKGRDTVSLRIESMFKEMSGSASYNPKIYKVHDELRQVNERAYDPVLVSIGPIHHNKDHLKPMEKIKASYLHHFLQVKNETVDKYVEKLRELEGRARDCYSNLIQLPEGDKFVEMLLLDGFFVIQLLRKLNFIDWEVENEYIFNSTKVTKRVMIDLLLVENQLPFFILSHLFDMTKSTHPEDNLSLLILKRLCWVLPWKQDVDFEMDDQNVYDHLLGMVHGAYFSSEVGKRKKKEDHPKYEGINTSVELKEAGVQLKTIKGVNLMDVSFNDGVMQLPHLTVSDYTETILRSLIAYEQMLVNQLYVSDYIMTDLVKSSKDVEILRHAGILENCLGDDEEVHLMFNQLGKHVTCDQSQFCYSEVFQSLNKHCNRRRNKWTAMLKRNYFNSPWAVLSVIAAIILLLLTTAQTSFSAVPYLK